MVKFDQVAGGAGFYISPVMRAPAYTRANGSNGRPATTRHRAISAGRGQPFTLLLAPLSRQSFQLAQRLIRDVSGWSMGGIGGRLIRHSLHSNDGPDDGSDWLRKRSARHHPQGGLQSYGCFGLSNAPSPIFHKSVQFSHFSGGTFRG